MLKYLKRLPKRFKRWMAFNPPGALTSNGWRSFDIEFRVKAPIRYWFHRDFKRIFVYPIKWKYEEIYLWIRYRTTDRYHIVKTGLPPGYDNLDKIMLHTNFNLLKDFVEIDLAYGEYWSNDTPKTWFEKHMPFYSVFVTFRKPELGIKHLEWASKLDDPSLPPHEQSPGHAIAARETLALYKWWVEDRPNRKSVEIRHPVDSNTNLMDIFKPAVRLTPEYKRYRSDLAKSDKQEARWEKEDDKMLIRLMKIRQTLWT